ncbi:hypothetical protein ABIC65_000239 [Sphingomonas trueperi]|uniref:hypothetical protein n=1 Tax=Sphingomonas trueperi TaxID=53317 RepID=UPI00339B09E5
MRFTDPYLRQGVEHHTIAGVNVPIYSTPKTLADAFSNPKLVVRSVAASDALELLRVSDPEAGCIANDRFDS